MLTKDLKDLVRAFNQNAVKYLIIGGHAFGAVLSPNVPEAFFCFVLG